MVLQHRYQKEYFGNATTQKISTAKDVTEILDGVAVKSVLQHVLRNIELQLL